MKVILGGTLFSIFLFLSVLHFYWAMGGKRFFYEALPERENGEKLFLPSMFSCIIVGTSLLSFGMCILAFFNIWEGFPNFLAKYTMIVIGIIFFLRAIGDFMYVGFTKRIISTKFAKSDTNVYSPLCVIISVLSILILIL